jgi:hypothetical protein
MRLSSKLSLAAAFALAASAGQAAAAGKTLGETLTLIRDSIAREGKVTYTVAMHDSADNSDWSQTMTSEATNVRYDEAACSLSFHWVTSADGETKQDMDGVMYFGRLGRQPRAGDPHPSHRRRPPDLERDRHPPSLGRDRRPHRHLERRQLHRPRQSRKSRPRRRPRHGPLQRPKGRVLRGVIV